MKFGTSRSDLPGGASKSQAPAAPRGPNLCSGAVPPAEGTSTPRWAPQQAATSLPKQHFQDKQQNLLVMDKPGTTAGVWGHHQTSLPPGGRWWRCCRRHCYRSAGIAKTGAGGLLLRASVNETSSLTKLLSGRAASLQNKPLGHLAQSLRR